MWADGVNMYIHTHTHIYIYIYIYTHTHYIHIFKPFIFAMFTMVGIIHDQPEKYTFHICHVYNGWCFP